MTTKRELAERIIKALLSEQRNPTPFADKMSNRVPLSFPPQVPVGNGQHLPATTEALRDITSYAEILRSNDGTLALSHSDEEIVKIVGQAFGSAFSTIDIDQSDNAIAEQAIEGVTEFLAAELLGDKHEEEIAYGCWVLHGPGTDDLQIGPVRIEARHKWLAREADLGRVSQVAARRVRRAWDGNRARRRVPSFDEAKERSILDTVGDCKTVCSVVTSGLSQKVAEQKAPLAARLAFTALALSWETPSLALDRMGLLIDGPIHKRHSISFSPTHISRLVSGISGIGGQFVTDEWLTLWPSLNWLVSPIGAALSEYVNPRTQSARPKINNALFLSLWWFHEACREHAPLLAIVKFAASLDALAGGQEGRGIRDLIAARLSIPAGSPLLKDGRTTAEVVKEIYSDARSRAIHGSTLNHGHDWGRTRRIAETLARLCITTSCGWIWENPGTDDLSMLRQAGP